MNERDFSPQNCFAVAFSKLDKLRTQNELCDVVLRLEGEEFHAHKVILISCCPYFEAMFLSGMSESRQRMVDLQGVNPDAFKAILRFFYTGSIRITGDNVQALLPAASILQLDDLRRACANFLVQQLAPCNCLGIRTFAQTYGCTRLEEQAWKHTLLRFVEVSSTEEFFQLDLTQVCQLLGSDHIKVSSEEQLFDAVLRWIEHCPVQRVQCMSQLLRHVRLPLLPLPVLADRVKCHQYIRDDLECRNLLDEALISYHLLPERRGSLPAERIRPRRCLYDMGVVYAVGGLSSGRGNLSSVERFDPEKSVWESSKAMTTFRSRVGVAVVDRKLFAFGGYDGLSRLFTVECYDPQRDEWSLKSPMTTRRSALSIAVLDKDVYIIGGYDGNTSLSSVEIYHVPSDEWSPCAGMNTCRSAAGAATLDGLIYVAGGHNGLSIFSSVECYNSQDHSWTAVPPMHSRRCRAGVTVLNGKLFSVGGYDGQSFLDTVECFDPRTNLWSRIKSMTCRRSRVGVAVLSNQIYAIGGYDGLANLSSVEVYNSETQEWTPAPPLTCHQGGVVTAVIPPE